MSASSKRSSGRGRRKGAAAGATSAMAGAAPAKVGAAAIPAGDAPPAGNEPENTNGSTEEIKTINATRSADASDASDDGWVAPSGASSIGPPPQPDSSEPINELSRSMRATARIAAAAAKVEVVIVAVPVASDAPGVAGTYAASATPLAAASDTPSVVTPLVAVPASPPAAVMESKGSTAPAILAITDRSVDVKLFLEDVQKDYICGLCERVPKRPVNPKCCGQISCKECLEEKLASLAQCPYCKEPCTMANVPASPFVTTKLAGLTCRCHVGCERRMLFGKEGFRLNEHKETCPNEIVICEDCKTSMTRLELTTHRPPGMLDCPKKPILCGTCNNLEVKRELWAAHQLEPGHVLNFGRQMASMVTTFTKQAAEIAAVKAESTAAKEELAQVKRQLHVTQRECDEKIASAEARYEQRMAELRAHSIAQFCEFEVPKWSEVKECALFSTATPLKAWGHEWWIKVEKSPDGRIGLFLCCGEEGPFPIHVDYQLMVRKRNDDLGVCASVVFRTEFGKEKAWGLSKFTTLDALEKDGAYCRKEDKLTFGCRILPIKNLVWGGHARPPTATR